VPAGLTELDGASGAVDAVEGAAVPGAMVGNKPAALPGLTSLLLMFSVGSGPGTMGAMPVSGEVGDGVAAVVVTSWTDSETASGLDSVAAETLPTALTVMAVAGWLAAGCLAVLALVVLGVVVLALVVLGVVVLALVVWLTGCVAVADWAVAWACSVVGVLAPGAGMVHELAWWQLAVVKVTCWPAIPVESEMVTWPDGVQSLVET